MYHKQKNKYKDKNINKYELNKETFKVWFHHFFYREEYDDRFYNDINVTIDSQYDYAGLLPYYNNGSIFDKVGKSEIKGSKFEDFKCRLRKKLGKHLVGQLVDPIFVEDAESLDSMDSEVEHFFNKFKSTKNEITTLFDTVMKDKYCSFDRNIDPMLLAPFQDLSYDQLNKFLINDRKISLNSFDSNPSQYIDNLDCNNDNHRTNLNDDSKNQTWDIDNHEENIGISPVEYVDIPTAETERPDVKQTISLRSLYLMYMQDNNLPSYKYDTTDKIQDEESLRDTSSTYSSSLVDTDSPSESDSYAISESSGLSKEKIVTIPTFRSLASNNYDTSRKGRYSNTPSILGSIFVVDNSKDSDDKMLDDLKHKSNGTTRNLFFYDKSEGNDITELSITSFSNVNSNDSKKEDRFKKRKANNQLPIKEELTVKFDKNSSFFQYRRSSRNIETKKVTFPSYTLPVNGLLKKEEPRSILKNRINSAEEEETRRAINCDNVNFQSFLKYLDHFESQRYTTEENLSKIRENQIRNYYSDIPKLEMTRTSTVS